ncbi:alpha/beta hydrolase [Cohnella hongkongensis]|uniref:Alpha/beta hydrolase n=1 Tax=Cohnella hongkongensis TaxID=178337 RepID=A0ABV9FAV0_9BACL
MNGTERLMMRVGGCEEHRLLSRTNGREYRILIARPAEAAPPGGYPVLYTLDGNATFLTMAEAARLQTRKPHGFDPAVIVGIGYPSDEPFDMNRRCYDFTMPAGDGTLPARPDGSPWPEHGGADSFLDFLECDLQPFVGERFAVDPLRQTIFGHSLGGLLVLHALFSRPELFSRYAAGSPSIWWGARAIVTESEAFIRSFGGRLPPVRLLFTIGANELPDMVGDAEALFARLQPFAGESGGFRTSFAKFPEEGHVSVLPAAISRVIRFGLSQDP